MPIVKAIVDEAGPSFVFVLCKEWRKPLAGEVFINPKTKRAERAGLDMNECAWVAAEFYEE